MGQFRSAPQVRAAGHGNEYPATDMYANAEEAGGAILTRGRWGPPKLLPYCRLNISTILAAMRQPGIVAAMAPDEPPGVDIFPDDVNRFWPSLATDDGIVMDARLGLDPPTGLLFAKVLRQ